MPSKKGARFLGALFFVVILSLRRTSEAAVEVLEAGGAFGRADLCLSSLAKL
jgi:hypothetical protein